MKKRKYGGSFLVVTALAMLISFSVSSRAYAVLLVSDIDLFGGAVLGFDENTLNPLGDFTSPDMSRPQGLTYGSDGKLYVATNNQVFRYNGSTGAFEDVFVTWHARLSGVEDLLFGPDGDLYVSSANNNTVLRYNGSTGAFIGDFVIAGSGGLSNPMGMTFDDVGNLLVVSTLTHNVLRYDSAGVFTGVFASTGANSFPVDAIFGPDTNLYVSNSNTNQIDRFTSGGGFINSWSSPQSTPYGLAFGPNNDDLYVSTFTTTSIMRLDGNTGLLEDFLFPTGTGASPTYMTFAPEATAVPEPTTIALLGIGIVGLAGAAVRRRLRQSPVSTLLASSRSDSGGKSKS